MNQFEEELQQQAERGEGNNASRDYEAYRHVFSALKQEPEIFLSASFADKVMQRVTNKALEKEAARDKWWFILGGVFFVGTLIFSMVAVEFKPGVGIFTFLAGYPGLFLFGAAFVLFLHYLDRKFIRTTTRV